MLDGKEKRFIITFKVQRISAFVELPLSNTLSILLLAGKFFFED